MDTYRRRMSFIFRNLPIGTSFDSALTVKKGRFSFRISNSEKSKRAIISWNQISEWSQVEGDGKNNRYSNERVGCGVSVAIWAQKVTLSEGVMELRFHFSLHPNWAISKFAADTRIMSFRYSLLCGTPFDAVDAVKLELPSDFLFSKIKLAQFLIIIFNFVISKIWNAQLGLYCLPPIPLSSVGTDYVFKRIVPADASRRRDFYNSP